MLDVSPVFVVHAVVDTPDLLTRSSSYQTLLGFFSI